MEFRSLRLLLLLEVLVSLSITRVEGDYQVLVTVHSLVLLESRCAECYGEVGESVQRNSCCDGGNTSSCPASCDVILRFCQLSDLRKFDLDDMLLNTQCAQSPQFSHAEDWLGNNFKTGDIYQFDEMGSLGGLLGLLSNPVTYSETGKWKGAQLNISVVDRDPSAVTPRNDFDDLIDHFTISINISAGSSVTRNFTGRYNYVQLELTIEVTCIANNTDSESCVCLPGFTGLLCENNINECIGVTCSGRGKCADEDNGYCCECSPGFSGQLCKNNIDDCVGVTCSGRGRCVDGIQNFSCNCDPGYTGAICESEMTSSSSSPAPVPLAAIIGGVIGGVVLSLILVILILMLVFKQRIKSLSVQAHNPQEDIDFHDYEEVEDETVIETEECAAYATQRKDLVDLENNPAYIYAQVAEQVAVELKECSAYATQEKVAMNANPAYQQPHRSC